MLEMDQVSENEPPESISPEDIIELIGRWKHDVEEVMVHTFDFLFFYGQHTADYISSIWHSWNSIPHLDSMIHEYVVRSVCVAAVRYLEEECPVRKAKRDVLKVLRTVVPELTSESYLGEAVRYLEQNLVEQSVGFNEILVRLPLVAVVKAFLHSPELLQEVRKRSPKRQRTSKRALGPGVLEFTGDKIENPLRFIEEFTRFEANVADSLWMLHRLAFDLE
jgi:hypothetical protein